VPTVAPDPPNAAPAEALPPPDPAPPRNDDDQRLVERLQASLSLVPESEKAAVWETLRLYNVEWDKVDEVLRFRAPDRWIATSDSYVSIGGKIVNGRVRAWLTFHYEGEAWIFARQITVRVDGARWDHANLRFSRDNYGGQVWEDAELSLDDPKVLVMARRIATAADAVVRFRGRDDYSDLQVSQAMKDDLRRVLDVIAVLNR
jgi:hypothetical protein